MLSNEQWLEELRQRRNVIAGQIMSYNGKKADENFNRLVTQISAIYKLMESIRSEVLTEHEIDLQWEAAINEYSRTQND